MKARKRRRNVEQAKLEERKGEEKASGGVSIHPNRDKELGGARRGQRAPPSFSLWLKADFFKRIVHRPANLPAASAAKHNGANVMRVTCLHTCCQNHGESAPLLHDGCTRSLLSALTGHCVVTYYRAIRSSLAGKFECPKRLFQNEMLSFFLVNLSVFSLL